MRSSSSSSSVDGGGGGGVGRLEGGGFSRRSDCASSTSGRFVDDDDSAVVVVEASMKGVALTAPDADHGYGKSAFVGRHAASGASSTAAIASGDPLGCTFGGGGSSPTDSQVCAFAASSSSSPLEQQQQQQQQRQPSGSEGWGRATEERQQQPRQPRPIEGAASSLDPNSLQLQNNLQFRFLHPNDIDELKSLCKDCFPVEYPEEWYQEITKDDGRFFSLASTLQGKIVGFIVAEIKTRVRCNKEDQDILSPSYPLSTPIAYILSLGVACDFRCQGVGSLLLDNLLSHLTSKDHHACKAVFLHVLCTNSRAIRFYEKRHFTKHTFLPLYYAIQGKLKDGFSYVLYLNGGHPPWSLRSSLRSSLAAVASLAPCKMSTRLFLRVNQLIWCFVAAVFVGIKKTTTTSFAHGGYHKS